MTGECAGTLGEDDERHAFLEYFTGIVVSLADFAALQEIRAGGTTILMVEQNALAALKIADYGCVLELGKISMKGPAEQLLGDKRLVEAYLGNKK